MANFSTNQTLSLYVAKDIKTITDDTVDPATVCTTVGDLAIGGFPKTSAEEMYFVYLNGDSKIVRSDLVKISNIKYLASTTAAKLATPLNKVVVTVGSDITLSDLVGSHIQLVVTLREFVGLDFSESYPIVVDIIGDSTNTATATALYTALDAALDEAIAHFDNAPFTVSSSSGGLVITEKAQKYVWGKLEGTPIHFDVSGAIAFESSAFDPAAIVWGSIAAPVASGSTISGNNKIADLERFSMGEVGDYMRETVWPYNYEPARVMDETLRTGTAYGMLTIQFYYAGDAEDVQKSPKTIYIAATDAHITELAGYIANLKAGRAVNDAG